VKKSAFKVLIQLYTRKENGAVVPFVEVTIGDDTYRTNERGFRFVRLQKSGIYVIKGCGNETKEELRNLYTVEVICPKGGIIVSPPSVKIIDVDLYTYQTTGLPAGYETVSLNGREYTTNASGFKALKPSGAGTYDITGGGNSSSEYLDEDYTIAVVVPNGGITVTPPVRITGRTKAPARAKKKAAAKSKKKPAKKK